MHLLSFVTKSQKFCYYRKRSLIFFDFIIMTLLIVGATGTLGRQIVRRALDEGRQVRCLVRSSRKAAFLKEWGAEIVTGSICLPDTLPAALEGVTEIIDASTARANDVMSIQQVDWQGKVNLIQAAIVAGVKRFIFFSILDAEKYRSVPLMDIKYCIEVFLKESGLDYTILRPCGFLQGLIGQYAIPVLEGQAVWMAGEVAPTAFMDTQDVARLAVKALSSPESIGKTLPVVGNRAWSGNEIISLCERYSGKEAKVNKVPLGLLGVTRRFARFFQWSWNAADRLAFAEVLATGKPLNADMTETYRVLGLAPEENTTMESYMQEYFSRIGKKLRELESEKEKLKQAKSKNKSKKKVFY
jgi:uncharacterized protein YbjT (DUF2867 family)